jgi:haloalkane dehalogenase
MKILRTPESCFEGLPGYDFDANFVELDGLRMHYVEQGPGDGEIVLLLHGEPSWSYLYRTMIPPLADAGFRAIAPDLIGFGKSDKPSRKSDYTYSAHVDWMRRFVEALDLVGINLFCQDWGSLIGLRVAAENEHRFARIALGNGGLPSGDQTMPDAFMKWRRFALHSPYFPIGKIIQRGTTTALDDDVVAAYDAPFPSRKYKAGARMFPALVPITPALPHLFQRHGPDHPRWRSRLAQARPRNTGTTSHDHRKRWPLPAGRQGAGTRGAADPLHPKLGADDFGCGSPPRL